MASLKLKVVSSLSTLATILTNAGSATAPGDVLANDRCASSNPKARMRVKHVRMSIITSESPFDALKNLLYRLWSQ